MVYVHNLMTRLGNMEAITLESPCFYKAHESPPPASSMWQEIRRPGEGVFKRSFEWTNSCCKSFMKAQMIYSHIKYIIILSHLKSTTLFIHIMVFSHSYLGRKKRNEDLLFKGKRRLSWLKCLSLLPISKSQLSNIINHLPAPRRIINMDAIFLTPSISLTH